MHLSQPAVSRLVQLLEAELGATLFYRDRTRLAPTPEAEHFYPEARRVIASVDDFPALFEQIRNERLVPLRVLCQLRVAEGLVVPALAEFGRRSKTTSTLSSWCWVACRCWSAPSASPT